MTIRIHSEVPPNFVEHGEIPIAFLSTGRVRSIEGSTIQVSPEEPFVKDYDSWAEDRPANLPDRFEVSNWGLIAAWDDARRVGGTILAWNTPGVEMLEDRVDLAVVWDLRIAPEHRRAGIGRRLWEASVAWARERDCGYLRVETQDINPDACRFYASMGCAPVIIRPGAYPESPGETQIIWEQRLQSR